MHHKCSLIAVLCAPMLLCFGCKADIKDRAYAETLAVHLSNTAQGTICYGEKLTETTAQTAALLPDALRQASGTAIYTGHLTTLLLSGKPFATLLSLSESQWVAPDCTVICTQKNAANLLAASKEDMQSLYTQAVKSGTVPLYHAGEILGMLQNGAQIAAMPYYLAEGFALALYDASDQQYGILSDAACRGAALYSNAWEKFQFAAEDTTCTLTRSNIACTVAETETGLFLTVECRARCDIPSKAAEAVIKAYLTAALQETLSHGADLFFLQERALRDGITWAADASPAVWQAALRQATFSVTVSLS
ncbi:MAG: hypothetical protein PUC41_03860 [Oscillospiraceae bacterium]|nr:hypothetical protein [Oscillospiraceae bacterium]